MIKRLLSSQLRINMASGVATTVVNIAVMAAGYPIYLHFLGYEKYGIWLVLATVLTFAQLGNLGMGPAVLKLVAEEYGRGDINGIQQYVTTALALLCVSGSFILIVVVVFKIQIVAAFKLSDENAKMVLWLLPYIGLLSIYVLVVQVFESVLSGLGRMDLANYIRSLSRAVNVIFSSLLLSTGWDVKSLLIGSVLSYLFIHIASLVCIWRIAPIRFLRIGSFDVYRCKRLFHFGGAVFGSSLISMLLSPFNKLMLSRYAGVSTVPIYEIAYNGGMQIRSIIEVGLRALMPEVSRIGVTITSCVRDRISHIYRRTMKFIFLFGVPMYAGLIIFAPSLLKLWLGERFVDEITVAFRIMLIASLLSLLCSPAYHILMGAGWMRQIVFSHLIQSTINFVLVIAAVTAGLLVRPQMVCFAVALGVGSSALYLIIQVRLMLRAAITNCECN
ncbi:MAG: oligosaccharide flippase family protein [Planctomycetota bacterium]|jgi:O-antigen/teichoic acid export membrane protein